MLLCFRFTVSISVIQRRRAVMSLDEFGKLRIRVDRRCYVYIGVSQDLLGQAQPSAVADEVVGEGVTQEVPVELRESGLFLEAVDEGLHSVGGEGCPSAGDEYLRER